MELPQGVTEVIVDAVGIENDRGTTRFVTWCTVSAGEQVGKRLKVKEPISGVCGQIEFDEE